MELESSWTADVADTVVVVLLDLDGTGNREDSRCRRVRSLVHKIVLGDVLSGSLDTSTRGFCLGPFLCLTNNGFGI